MVPLQFAYWVPNVSGGLVVSKIPQRTDHSLEYNVKLAQIAEDHGFNFALTQIRFLASYGADEQHESVSFSHAILAQTKRLQVIAAVLPGPWNPTLAAKVLAGIHLYTGGRIAVNVVSGWFKQEFISIGEPWLEHEERYRRSSEFIQVLRGIWSQSPFNFAGEYYKYVDYNLSPKPIAIKAAESEDLSPAYPTIFMGGNSVSARTMASTYCDWFFMNGNTDQVISDYILDVRKQSHALGRVVKTAVNGFVILRDTEEEAVAQLNAIINGADLEAVAKFNEAVKEAGQSAKGGQGMWATASLKDNVQFNEGFRTGLIGTAEIIARRIIHLKSLGVDLVLTAYLHFQEEIVEFAEKVMPLVRKYEEEAIASGEASKWPTFDNYPALSNGTNGAKREGQDEGEDVASATKKSKITPA
ncbi:dimethylsulfone monooxygenase, partial [Tremellales sp. Uapishka_1]